MRFGISLFQRAGIVCSALLLVSACQRETAVTPTVPDLDRGTVGASSQSPRPPLRTLDDDYAALVSDVPGFGGLFYDSTGTLTVYLKNPATLGAIRSRIGTMLARGSASRSAHVAPDVARMRAQPATFDFRELLSWYRGLVTPAVAAVTGVTMTDVDERQNRIVIGVRDASLIPNVQAVLARLPIPDSRRRGDGSYFRPR